MSEDLPDPFRIRKPARGQVELWRLYDKRTTQERQFPGVDIDRIHRKLKANPQAVRRKP